MNTNVIEMDRWVDGTVPDNVVKVVFFIWATREETGKGPTWAEIAEFGGWAHRPRDAWKPKMRLLKRYGVVSHHKRARSTKVVGEVVPYMLKATKRLRVGAA